jgi:mycothiol synthase
MICLQSKERKMKQAEALAQPRVPAAYSTRPLTLNDADMVAELLNAVYVDQGNPERRANPDDVRIDWQSPKFDLTDSSAGVFDQRDQLVAYLCIWDNSSMPVHPWLDWAVHPEHFAPELLSALLGWGLEQAYRVIDRLPDDVRVSVRTRALTGYTKAEDALQAAGFALNRYFYRMRIDMTEAPPAPMLADGFSIRPVRYPDEFEKMVAATEEAFQDHYGYVDEPFEELLKEWNHWVTSDPLFDPAMWLVAVEDATGEIAGITVGRDEQFEDPTVAYVAELAVRAPYRRKGLALALLHHIFGLFYARGKPHVTLHVDADSLTGAVRLYERAGMSINEQRSSYEYELRPGREIARQ